MRDFASPFHLLLYFQGGYPWTYLSPHELTDEEKARLLRSFSCPPKERREIDSSVEAARPFEQLEKTVSTTFTDDGFEFVNVPLDSPAIDNDKAAEDHKTTVQPVNQPSPRRITASKPGVLRSFLKRANSAPKKLTISKPKPTEEPIYSPLNSPTQVTCCHPFVDKLKTMADKQLNKVSHKRSIKRVNLDNDNKIVLREEQKILKLRESPKAERRELAQYVEKRDSDEIMEIIELDESPSEVRKRREHAAEVRIRSSSVLESDEIPELPKPEKDIKLIEDDGNEPTIAELLEEEFKNDPPQVVAETVVLETKSEPPQKAPRKPKDHIYEDIENPDDKVTVTIVESVTVKTETITTVTDAPSVEEPKDENQDESSSTEEHKAINEEEFKAAILTASLAPHPSMDSESSGEGDEQLARLSAVTEESEQSSVEILDEKPAKKEELPPSEKPVEKEPEIKSALKSRESSLGPDKRVTFSASTEDREESMKEDVTLPDHIVIGKRWSNMR